MALMPKRVKYRKHMRGKNKGNASRRNYVAFGEFGLQALEPHWITGRQIEAGRVAATHFLKREGKVYIRIFPDHSYTSKPLEVRMGKGKAEVAGWVSVVKPGTMLYEIGGVEEEVAKEALLRVAHKMPVKCRFVTRRHSLG
ncbi:MAG: 50S ribosomal protein L16 [Planctomycetota bacterium]